jgi:hypothetical protein
MMPGARRLVGAWALAAAAGALVWAQGEPVRSEKTLFVDSQESYRPGYAIGDIAIAQPEIADFRVLPGRRELLLIGKSPGTTTLIIWDQQKVKREEIEITVATREDVQAEQDLKELVADFPDVQVRRVRGQLALTGIVQTQQDFDAVQRLADAAGATNLVRLVAGRERYAPTSTEPARTEPGAAPTAPAARPTVAYEVIFLEASVAFTSGTYGIGVEPSGRTLYRQQVSAPLDGEAEVFVPGATIMPKASSGSRDKKGAAAEASSVGLRMKLQPRNLQEDGSFTTFVAIETNVPVPGHTDPTVMRRARWELSTAPSEPFGLAGAELFAVPEIVQSGSKLGKAVGIAGMVSGLPGVSQAPGASYAGSVPYYDREKKTQVLALVRPALVDTRR